MDQSALDKKYFLTHDTYNCPFCKRGSVKYSVTGKFKFDWSNEREVHGYLVKCAGCSRTSLHLSDTEFYNYPSWGFYGYYDDEGDQVNIEEANKEIDNFFFYHQPTSFFTIDKNIPRPIRDLITEADGCLKMNFLVGGSGALRKAIYEFLNDQEAGGKHYEDRIKSLKTKYPNIYEGYFDILANVQDMTSENLHEQDGSWEPWSASDLRLFIGTVKEVLQEIYVNPDQRASAVKQIMALKNKSTLKNLPLEDKPKTNEADDQEDKAKASPS